MSKNIIILSSVVFIFSTFSIALKANTACEYPLSAEYRYTITDEDKELQQHKTLTLWRRENQVVIQTTDNHQSELWELTKNHRIKMTRFFEDHQRGIEYQPNEVKSGREKNDWSMKYQLVSDLLINKMNKNNGSTEKALGDCKATQHLYLSENNKMIELLWSPQQKLMESLTVKEGSITTHWALNKKISDEKLIDQYFDQLLSYQTTDYADIGDNESDPFLLKMINLGFVEHGASGFYDTEGNQLGGQEASHGHHGH